MITLVARAGDCRCLTQDSDQEVRSAFRNTLLSSELYPACHVSLPGVVYSQFQKYSGEGMF